MNDLISRQAAIDAIEHRLAEPAYQHTGEDWYVGMNCAESELYELPSAQPYTDEEIQMLQELEQAELQKAYECGRASAQPDIIRCKDCKHYYEGGWYCSAWNNSPGFPIVTEEGYCNLAERRTG